MINQIYVAKKYLGLKEIPGPKHNNVILGWLTELGAWWKDDETPWCGVFVAECFRQCGSNLPKYWYRAKGWLDWGIALKEPIDGCVVILEREGGGHVFIFMGYDKKGNIVGIGGNQGNQVSIAAFDKTRVIGYRWPAKFPLHKQVTKGIDLNGKVSQNEQ